MALRDELQTQYPLAAARTWLDVEGQELVRKVQETVGLERRLALVVVRTGQRLMWSNEAKAFNRSIEWTDGPADQQIRLVRPLADVEDVILDPLRGFGEPVLRDRNVKTELLGELYRAGETVGGLAEVYELTTHQVEDALRYELRRATSAAAT